jgi:uncharacterized repeat protein (TIGR01451 family)
MRINNQKRIAPSQTTRTLQFLVLLALFLTAGVLRAQSVWNKNQTFLYGASGTITSNYETTAIYTQSFCPGTPVHIVYGISDPAGSSNAVTVTIGPLPTAFAVTKVQVLRFSGGTLSSTQTPTAAALASGYSIGALAVSTDHVIIVIDGYFTQASTYSVSFKPSRSDLTPPQITNEATSVNMDVSCKSPPVNLSIVKTESPSSVAFGSSVTYTLTVKNTAAAQTNHSTDLYLGSLLRVFDTMSVSGNDVPITFSASPPTITGTAGVVLMSMPTNTISNTLPAFSNSSASLWTFSYPTSGTGSDGYLPAGGSFSITFTVLINTTATCSVSGKNNLGNSTSLSFSGGFSDSIATDNSSTVVLPLTGLPLTPCPTPTAIPALTLTKKLLSPTTPAWGVPFTYQITFTNTTGATLTGLGINDGLAGIGTPLFTANFNATNVVCTPACTSVTPATAAPFVGNAYAFLFSASFGPLAPGATQTVTYQVQYDTPCAGNASGGVIRNYAGISSPATNVVTGSTYVDTNMPALTICDLQASKTQTGGPTSFSTYTPNPTLKFHIQFRNKSNQTITVGTVRDAMALDSAAYGNVPVTYSYTATATGVSRTPALALTNAGTTSIQYSGSVYAGNPLIDFGGAVFAPGGTIDCDLSVTLQQPSTTDSLCQGQGNPHLKNVAFMNLIPYNTSQPPQAAWHQEVMTPLPYCISIRTAKIAPPNVTPGGPVTFTITVTNQGKDPISNVVLQDNVLPAFTNVTWTCATGCTAASGSGNNLNVALSPNLAPGATVTILVHATAPTELGAYCNEDLVDFNPFPPSSYFEGDPKVLLKGDACIQVVPAVGTSPTPTPTATPRETSSPTPTATATPTATPVVAACSQVVAKEVRCDANGSYSYAFTVTNNSGSDISQILLSPVSGSTFSLSPQLFNLSTPLHNGQSTTQSVKIGSVKPGTKVCFFVTLMSDRAACCTVQACAFLPVCDPTPKPR